MRQRVLVVGWDGADWDIVDDLLARGLLPNLAEMLSSGGRGTLLSTIPSHSWAAWSSFLTGYQPAGHGVWDFVERHPTDPDRRIPVSSTSIRRPTFLDQLSSAGAEVRAANIPVTFPAWEVKGRMIGGVAVPKGASFVTPKTFAAELESRAPFPTNGLEWTRFAEEPDVLVAEARRLVERRTRSFEVLLEGSWDVAVCVYVAPDRVQHPMGAFLLPAHPRYGEVAGTDLGDGIRAIYAAIDEALGRLRAAAGPGALTIVLSDHGFRPVARVASLARILRHLGYSSAGSRNDMARSVRRWGPARALARSRAGYALKRRVRAPATLDWSKTTAYSAGSGGAISINLRGREIEGIVEPADHGRVRREVADALLAYRDPASGQAPVASVLVREELPGGDHADTAPDLIARPSPLWSFGNIDQVGQESEWPSGDHRQQGILVASEALASDLGEPSIVDIAPTLLATQGLSAPGDGQPIAGLVRTDAALDRAVPMASVTAEAPGGDVTAEEQDEIAQHLRDLGYIE